MAGGIGALTIPGFGPSIAAGPILSALAGAGVGGTVGGIAGALMGMGIPEYEAKRYEGRVKDGGILLSVHSDDSDWTRRAKAILRRTGAQDISSTGESAADETSTDFRLGAPPSRIAEAANFDSGSNLHLYSGQPKNHCRLLNSCPGPSLPRCAPEAPP